MKKISGIVNVIGLIVKYSAIVMAIIKGVQVVYEELKKIDFGETIETSKKVDNE